MKFLTIIFSTSMIFFASTTIASEPNAEDVLEWIRYQSKIGNNDLEKISIKDHQWTADSSYSQTQWTFASVTNVKMIDENDESAPAHLKPSIAFQLINKNAKVLSTIYLKKTDK